jgi:hypothetical protein
MDLDQALKLIAVYEKGLQDVRCPQEAEIREWARKQGFNGDDIPIHELLLDVDWHSHKAELLLNQGQRIKRGEK